LAFSQVAIDGEWVWEPDNPTLSAAPPAWDEIKQDPGAPMVTLESSEYAAADKLKLLAEWNRAGRRPTQNGITHDLEETIRVTIEPDFGNPESVGSTSKTARSDRPGQIIEKANGDVIWFGSIHVENAYRLRIRLDKVNVPEEAQMWVQGAGDEIVGPFGNELIDDRGGLWTPSVGGPELTLTLLVSAGDSFAEFSITKIAELFRIDSSGQPVTDQSKPLDSSCLQDSQCFSEETFQWIEYAEDAVARIDYINSEGLPRVCSGALMNDTVEASYIPYFLTANHCIPSQSEANSLEVFWDYKPTSCGGSAPTLGSRPRSNGASLLVTREEADFALLELHSIPSGRYLLGWQTGNSHVSPGTTLHRVSHPHGRVAHYSQSAVDGGTEWCTGWPRPTWIYQSQVIGGVTRGSSGSPVLLASGRIVGVHSGRCGGDYDNDCDYANLASDGSLTAFWPLVQPHLNPNAEPAPADLEITQLDARNGTYASGDGLQIVLTIRNIGGVDSEDYRVTFYASPNTTITSSDHEIYHFDLPSMPAGASEEFTAEGAVPAGIPDGQYYIGAILTVSDANSNNNTRYDSTRITIDNSVASPADLSITELDAESGTYAAGDTLRISYRIENLGGTESSTYRITFYASPNTTITDSDYALGYMENSALSPGEVFDIRASGPIPSGIPDGEYYIGAILTVSDANSSNNKRYDSTRITIRTASTLKINPGLNGAWYNPATDGQGFFIDVLPAAGIVFLSWFTYDTVRPPSSYDANLGEPGHRWLTAQGPYNGNTATLDVYLTEGGEFDSSSPKPTNREYGTIQLEFTGCNSGKITYTIPGVASNRVIVIERVAPDNVGLCESQQQQQMRSMRDGEVPGWDKAGTE
jgi:hypothetical protein